MWLGNFQTLPYLFQSLNITNLGVFTYFLGGGGGWILFQLIDPNLEHTIRIRIKTKGIDMKSKLIGGLKKIFLPKKRRERVRMFQKLGKYSL